MYRAVHGEDDKKHSPTVKSEESRIDNLEFDELINIEKRPLTTSDIELGIIRLQ